MRIESMCGTVTRSTELSVAFFFLHLRCLDVPGFLGTAAAVVAAPSPCLLYLPSCDTSGFSTEADRNEPL